MGFNSGFKGLIRASWRLHDLSQYTRM